MQLPNISNNITVKLDSAGGGAATKATGSVTVAYPTASASPTYNASGTLESNHHGDTFTLDGRTFTVNYEGTGSFGDNEIKTYEQTGSALFSGAETTANNNVGLKAENYDQRLSQTSSAGMSFSIWFNRKGNCSGASVASLLVYNAGNVSPNEFALQIGVSNAGGTSGTVKVFTKGDANIGPKTTTSAGENEVSDNKFHHTVVTFESGSATGSCKIYLDGDEIASGIHNAFLHTAGRASTNLFIKDSTPDPPTAVANFNGAVQNVCVWDGILSATDANTLYNSGSVKDPTVIPYPPTGSYSVTLKGWWRLDSGSTGFQSAGDTPATQYISHAGTEMNAVNPSQFSTTSSVVHGVPFERHTPTEFYNAVTGAFNTGSIFGTFNVETPNLNNSIISITASNTGTAANNKITHSANETFITAVDTDGGADAGGGGGGSLRVHFRSTGSLPNVANNRHYWELSSASEKIEMNVKTKEIYLSADGGDCDFSLQADLTNIPTSSMYQHTGSGVDE